MRTHYIIVGKMMFFSESIKIKLLMHIKNSNEINDWSRLLEELMWSQGRAPSIFFGQTFLKSSQNVPGDHDIQYVKYCM